MELKRVTGEKERETISEIFGAVKEIRRTCWRSEYIEERIDNELNRRKGKFGDG